MEPHLFTSNRSNSSNKRFATFHEIALDLLGEWKCGKRGCSLIKNSLVQLKVHGEYECICRAACSTVSLWKKSPQQTTFDGNLDLVRELITIGSFVEWL